MKDRLEIRSVRPHDLIPNPLNAEIYDSTPTPDLIESIRQHGIIEPLVATDRNVLLSGHRRRLAAIELGIEFVPAIVRPTGDELGEIIAFNTHRKKKWSELYNEARKLKPRAEDAAAKRRLEGARRGGSIRHGNKEIPAKPRKRAIEDVAERLNLSREILRKLMRIMETVEKKPDLRFLVDKLDAGELTVHQTHRYVCRSESLAQSRITNLSSVQHGSFEWAERVCWTDVWEFYGRRDNGFHEVETDQSVLLSGSYGAPPADLFLNLVHHFSEPGGLVVDPFAGRGQLHEIAEAMGRRAWSSDLHPRSSLATERDALSGPPPELGGADLVVLDPPYGNDYRYSTDDEDISHFDIGSGWTQRIAGIARTWSMCLGPTGVVALIIGNRFDEKTNRMLDRTWAVASELQTDFAIARRIIVPYSPSHFRGFQVERAKRNGFMLSRSREILVLRIL